MQTATAQAGFIKAALVRTGGTTQVSISTNNNEIGQNGKLLIPTGRFYQIALQYGSHMAKLLQQKVAEAKANGEDASYVYEKLQDAVIGDINNAFGGGSVTISMVAYEKGDRIPITERSYDYYIDNGMVDTEGNAIEVVEEDGKYFVIARKDWESVTVTDLAFEQSLQKLVAAEMAKQNSLQDLLQIKPVSLNIFKKKVKDPGNKQQEGHKIDDKQNDPFETAEPEPDTKGKGKGRDKAAK